MIKTDFLPQPRPPEDVLVTESSEDLPENISVGKKVETLVKRVSSGASVKLSLENSSVSEITISVSRDLENVSISFEKKEGPGTSTPSENEFGSVYTYLEIDAGVSEDSTQEVSIKFKVSRDWIDKQGVDNKDVRLLRYSGGEWENLPTEVVGSTDSHFVYSSETPGFSIFAISAVETEEAEQEAPTIEVPWKLIGIVAIFGIIGGAIVFKKGI